MSKTILYIACSLNGKIATNTGSVEWLEAVPNPKKLDYGYQKFYNSIGITIQGNTTYQQIMGWGIDFPYPDKTNYVFTRNSHLKNTKFVTFISENHIEFVKKLKKENNKDIWIVGGAKINNMLLNAGLVDEIKVFFMPIVLSDGINLFGYLPKQTLLKTTNTKTFDTGVVEIDYTVENKTT